MLSPRLRPRRRRALAIFASSLAVLAAIAVGCSEDPLASPQHPDSGAQTGTLGDSVCPDAAPDGGEGCVLPEGTTCAFGACSARSIAQCTLGLWRYSGNPPPHPPCPTDFPVVDSVCPPCWPSGVECTYGSCQGPDASASATVASCSDGGSGQPQRWSLRSFTCTITDAGADVQRDAEPDAD